MTNKSLCMDRRGWPLDTQTSSMTKGWSLDSKMFCPWFKEKRRSPGIRSSVSKGWSLGYRGRHINFKVNMHKFNVYLCKSSTYGLCNQQKLQFQSNAVTPRIIFVANLPCFCLFVWFYNEWIAWHCLCTNNLCLGIYKLCPLCCEPTDRFPGAKDRRLVDMVRGFFLTVGFYFPSYKFRNKAGSRSYKLAWNVVSFLVTPTPWDKWQFVIQILFRRGFFKFSYPNSDQKNK